MERILIEIEGDLNIFVRALAVDLLEWFVWCAWFLKWSGFIGDLMAYRFRIWLDVLKMKFIFYACC